MNVDSCYKIGYIAKTHGLKGEVTFVPSPECPDLAELSSFFIEQKSSLVPYFIESVSARGDQAFVKLEDVNDQTSAGQLKGCSVYAPKSERAKLPRGEFYNDEVIGFEVNDTSLGTLGSVIEIEEAGPNRFLVLTYNSKEVMVPVNGPFIKSINKSRKQITVELPEGFLDI
ncbi:MAG: ribosome maturation factor RimM [Bacteroidota bacterium]